MTQTSPKNILFLMADQMQGRALQPDHPCQTPNADRLAQRGVRFNRAYTPNAICSPARASLMTGLLPHNHGVLWVTQNVDEDQGLLRRDERHWAQELEAAGYRTGYFGKWHVEREERPDEFGWQTYGPKFPDMIAATKHDPKKTKRYSLSYYLDQPEGYEPRILYGVLDEPPDSPARSMGKVYRQAADFLNDAISNKEPWCCFVSFQEPHDPFICGQEAYDRYDPDALELAPNVHDYPGLNNKPGLYTKAAQTFAGLSDKQKREIMACYYASITELDELWGRIIDQVEQAGQLDDTIIVITSDHGELLGAHGLYCKNLNPSEEVYNIPLIMSGPGIAQGETTPARVGLHDLCPTLLELTGMDAIEGIDASSFAGLLANPGASEADFTTGYSEYHGGRYMLTQRIYWEDDWKFIFNGFDWDELYNLADDPFEMNNLARDPAHADRVKHMMSQIWKNIIRTDDRPLANAVYVGLRPTVCGPGYSS